MLDKVKDRLLSFGYEVLEEDEFLLIFSVEKVRETIRNTCNLPDIPAGLEYIAADMAAGEFLLAKKTFAPEKLQNLDLDYAVKQIQVGDTSTTFAVDSSQTPEQRLDIFISHLMTYGRAHFSRFRRLSW